ncbi:MAG: AAA family ATPase [Gallionella sp.]|nr:AAA family ATPase [Gallionella sp.]
MRIERLDLLRYGKFTGKSVSLPKAARDFHLIIGPNEAGKSTLRSAIQDLLFGIEIKSRYDFIHSRKEMLVGASISQSGEQLDFVRSYVRTKVAAKTLQNIHGAPLPDNALLPFTGPVDRVFFDRMFGLNHERLVSGGQEMLSASNDIGQMLFQAAAGIGSLGEIRDKLEAEADQLWTKNKSGSREYYIASAELALADAALKQAIVRTKDWQEARDKVGQITESIRLAQVQYRALETERVRLERVRRVAPVLGASGDVDRELAALGAAALLPADAAAQLAHSEHDIAINRQSLMLFEQQLSALEAKIKLVRPDELILCRAQDIEALSATRQQLRNHEGDILRREGEIQILSQAVDEYARQLGWTEQGEQAVSRRLPTRLVRSAIDHLVRRHEALTQVLANAQETHAGRVDEVNSIDAEIAALNRVNIPAALTEALAHARSFGDVSSRQRHLDAQMGKLQRELDALLPTLGPFNPGIGQLRALHLPARDEIADLIRQRRDLGSTLCSLNERLADTKAAAGSLQRDISNYQSRHHPVTLADVKKLRDSRDLTWKVIKTGIKTLAESADFYEREVADSDALSDQRHDTAQQAIELQSRTDRMHDLQQKLADLESRIEQITQETDRIDANWRVRINAIGLEGMSLSQVTDWREAREEVLRACEVLTDAQVEKETFANNIAQARANLTEAVLTIRPSIAESGLAELILLAEEIISTARRDHARLDALTGQKIRAEAAIPDLSHRVIQAQSSLDQWRSELEKNLSSAHLPTDANMGAIVSACELFERMTRDIEKIREIRINRIDAMRADLDDFASAAASLAEVVAPTIAQQTAGQIALTLAEFLQQARSELNEQARLRAEFDKVKGQERAAASTIVRAQAALLPLLQLSCATDNEGLRAAIEQSDRRRILRASSDSLKVQLLQAGDGLGREVLEAECSAVDTVSIASRLSEINVRLNEVVNLQNRLSGEQNSAVTALGKIAGQDEAARAESKRQEALARMSNAAERYIKVCTAAKLLRWSIERFREAKQGPMLARAGEIFCGLTRGGFVRLAVDYESEPLKLSGQRVGGELVDIDGMSEGTRDQLYLALRLAALELHLEQTIPLPFIADDLFINYDDDRVEAGFTALSGLSEMTQVIFLSHHAHLIPVAQQVFGSGLNIINLSDLQP